MIIEKFGSPLDIFKPIISPVIVISKAFLKMYEFTVLILEIFGKTIEAALNIFNPDKLINDVLYGITHGITSMFSAIVDKIDIGGGSVDKKKDGGPFGVTEKKQATCIPPTLMNLLILVLCPPLALFLNKGFSGGWFITIICSLMTYFMYYFPGFIFAALHILC